jgi:hypothetical protein
MGVSFTIAAGPPQLHHSQVRVPGTHDHILLSQIRDSPNLEGQVPVFVSPRNSVLVILPGTGFPFRRFLWLSGLWWKYSTLPPWQIGERSSFIYRKPQSQISIQNKTLSRYSKSLQRNSSTIPQKGPQLLYSMSSMLQYSLRSRKLFLQ